MKAPACKFYLQGRCQRGQYCRYSHTGRPIPLATGIKQPDMIPEFVPDAMTATFSSGVKATFTDGIEPIYVDIMHASRDEPHIISLNSALLVTWYEPSRTVWLYFDSEQKTQRAQNFFIDSASYGTPRDPTKMKPGPDWYLVVNGVPAYVSQMDLLNVLPPDASAKSFFFGRATYPSKVVPFDEVKKQIQKHTPAAITVEGHRPKKNSLKGCSVFSFQDLSNVEGLVKALDGLKVPELGNTELHAQQDLVLKLGVKLKMFKEKKAELKSLESEIWQSEKVKTSWTAPNTDFIILNVFASRRDALASAKKQLCELFSEKAAMSVRPNLGKAPKPQEHRIRLTKTSAYKNARNAIGQMRDEFGAEVVSLDEDSNPPAVIVKGDTATLRKVQKYLLGDGAMPKSKTVSCAICLDEEAEDWVKLTRCGHTGCRDCLVSYLTINPGEGNREFPLRCYDAECDAVIPLVQIYTLLSREQMRELMSESFERHLLRHPDVYVTCPGTDCQKLHVKEAKNSGKRLCEQCLTDFCGHCRSVFHFGMSCEEYQVKVVEDEEALERWMQESGAKKCPKCTAIVQKDEGCNNVNCNRCGANFCWVCLETAGTHEDVYKHLMRKHGGYFDNEIARMEQLVGEMDPAEAAINGLAGLQGQAHRLLPLHVRQRMIEMMRNNEPLAARPAIPPERAELVRNADPLEAAINEVAGADRDPDVEWLRVGEILDGIEGQAQENAQQRRLRGRARDDELARGRRRPGVFAAHEPPRARVRRDFIPPQVPDQEGMRARPLAQPVARLVQPRPPPARERVAPPVPPRPAQGGGFLREAMRLFMGDAVGRVDGEDRQDG